MTKSEKSPLQILTTFIHFHSYKIFPLIGRLIQRVGPLAEALVINNIGVKKNDVNNERREKKSYKKENRPRTGKKNAEIIAFH
jgi:hypothetical protein